MLLIAALGISVGTSAATPAPEAPAEQVAPGINYTVDREGDSAVATIDAGAFVLNGVDGAIEVRDDAGNLAATVPTFFRLDDIQHPLRAALDETGRVLRLTPDLDPAAATVVPAADRLQLSDIAGPETREERDREALRNFQQQLGITTAITSIVAAIIGGGLGCLVGGLTGGALTPFLGFTGAIPGCIGGALAFAPVTALAGTIFVGGGALIILGIQYFDTINSPFVEPEAVPAA
ncbi:hypothetical protein SAMN05444695_113105 [Rhodococcus triatomae]|uniref:DUF8020 domain-containing protein n=2 Tax=Rhodococcus triatomae TaxID=300028 RepID=A0A1G8PQZ0_9NOCA|nr:hypothetical protein SAMN05444695_113105 [Rhodococcus triatomae]